MQPNNQSVVRELKNIKAALDESAIVAITDSAGIITHVNDKFCEISGYSERELLGQNHRILASGLHSKDFFADMWSSISSGKTWVGEICNRSKQGELYWVHTTIVPLLSDNKKPEEYVAIRFEITQRKLFELQLQESRSEIEEREQNLRKLFDATFEGIVVHEVAGKILDFNSSAAKILGCKPNELLERNLEEFIHPDHYALIQKEFANPNSHTFELKCHMALGKKIDLEFSTKPYLLSGKNLRISAFRDITERKELQTKIIRQERLATAGLLASSLAHEVGTPLGVIRGRAEYLEMKLGAGSEETRRDLHVIVEQIDRVTKLIQSLLAFSRGGKISADLGPVRVREAFLQVENLLSHDFQRNGIQYEIECEPTAKVMAELSSLQQVLINLLVNSLHAIQSAIKKEGRTEHFIKVVVKEKGEYWEIAVSDSGCGIPEENLNQIFKPFFTTKDIGQGTGLGLATTFQLVESWKGAVHVESEVGKGTTFRLELLKI